MSSKEIVYDRSARKQICRGVDALANTVKVTLGPRGRNVALDKSWGAPNVTKDGVTVAKEIELGNKVSNLGVEMVKEVASRTNDDTGDGTTTATVLAQSIFRGGLALIEAGVNAMDLKRGMDKACEKMIAQLRSTSVSASSQRDVKHIAMVSANGDESVGGVVADAMERVTKDGTITIELAQGMTDEVDIVEGMQFDRGYISPYFITNQEDMLVELESPYVLVVEKKLSVMKDLVPVLEAVNREGASLLLIAEDVEGEALAALVVNKIRGVLKVAAVKAPGFGERRKEMLKDIAALTGARAFMEDLGRSVDSAGLDDLGKARRVEMGKEHCIIIDGKGEKAEIQGRIEGIRRDIEATNSTYDKDKLNERLARLSGGVAVIKVGAPSELEQKERRARFEDALAATRAAVEEGYVAGGGVALLRAREALKDLKLENKEQQMGADLLAKAAEAPLLQIAANAGLEPRVVVAKVSEGSGAYGYDAHSEEYGDLVERGIIDPVKVVRTALQNATSIAGLMLTTECAIVERPKPPAPAPGAGAGGMGGMGMGGMGGMGMGGMGGMGMDDLD